MNRDAQKLVCHILNRHKILLSNTENSAGMLLFILFKHYTPYFY